MRPKPTILLCEDEELIRWALEEHLAQSGFETVVAENGESCWSCLSTHALDAVILDLVMPRLSGLDVLRQLRARDTATPVLLLTAYNADHPAVKEALQLGVDAYLEKPFELVTITNTLNQMLTASS